MTKAATEIRRILFAAEKSEAWLAEQLGISPQRMFYILGDNAKTMDVALYDRIMQIFEEAGYLEMPDAHTLHDHGMRLGCTTNEEIGKITRMIMRVERHENVSANEKKKIREALNEFKKKIDDEILLVLEHLEEM